MTAIARIWTADPQPIEDENEERATIDAAKLGDEEAFLRLFAAYVPLCRWAVARLAGTLDREDAQQAAILGLLDAVHNATAPRLAGIARERITQSMGTATASAETGFTVPERTLRRALGILAVAEGNIDEAKRIAPEYEMSPATLLAVVEAVKRVHSLDEVTESSAPGSSNSTAGDSNRDGWADMSPLYADREISDSEDRDLVRKAFDAVDDVERMVCRMAYGFTEAEPVPDAEIGHRLGMGRVRTLRTRHRALDKMRSALAA